MPNNESALRFLFRIVWPSKPAGGRRHTLVERLTELRDTKDDFLTEGEYAEIRSEILGELATRPRMPFTQVFIFLAFGIAGIVGIIYFLFQNMLGSAWVPALPSVACGLMWWRSEHDYAAKRNLSRDERLRAVEELSSLGLISSGEADALRTRVERLGGS